MGAQATREAWITGKRVHEQLAAWLFRATGQAPAIDASLPGMEALFAHNGFEVRHEMVEFPGSRVLVMFATKLQTQ